MQKPARNAPGPGVRLFDVAAAVMAFPLAAMTSERLADRHWVPMMDTLAPAIVLALALWAMSAWIHQLYVARRERPYTHAMARVMRIFAAGAVVLVAVAALTKQHTLSPLLTGLYLAFALTLLVGARLGRTVATGTDRGRRARYDVAAGANGMDSLAPPDPAARAGVSPAGLAAAREIEVATAWQGQGGPCLRSSESAPAPHPDGHVAPEPAGVLDAIRSCMDEVSYTPGSPNVLSMTKYLHGERAGSTAADPGAPRALRRLVDGEAEASFARIDDGEETVLEIRGVLDAVSVQDVRPTVEALVAEGRTSIRVDLSALRLIDSSGVGLIVGLYKRCRAFGGTVQVSGLKDQPLAVFRLLRLDRIFVLQ
ncbi:MAG TPA: STAS domain-containing protein [Anaeromyxobacter sp.]